MDMFKMYAEYKDGFRFEIIKSCEEMCMSDIADASEKHGECTFYTWCNGYDKSNDCYWVDGEYFSGFDDEKQEYIK